MKNRANIAGSILQSPDVLKEAYNMSTNDYAGSAQEELSRHLDGIEGRINKFNNTVQEFWFNLISSDTIKFVVSAGTEIVSIVGAISDAIGELGTIMVAATGYTALYWSAHKGDDGNVAIKLLESIGTKIGLIQRDSDRATISISGFVSKIKDLWSTSKGFRAATIAGVAVAAIGLIYKGYKEYQEKIQQQADDATKKWSQESSTLKDYNSKYAELKGKLDSGNLSEEETLSIKKEILDIQYKITDKYGEQAKNIDLVNGSLEKQLSILQNISAEEAQETLNEGRAGYIKAEEEMTELRSYFLSGTGLNTTLGGVSKDIYNIAKKFEEAGVKINENASGQFSVSITATADDVDKTINDVMSKVSDLKKKYKNDKKSINVIDSFLDVSSNSLNENKKILDNYYENYKSYLEQSLYAQGDADKLFDFGEAVDNYNDALLSGDTSKIDEAREAYKVALEAKNEFLLLEGNEKYSDMFDDISEQLDKATIKYLDFEEIVSGSSGGSSNNQFKEQSKDIKECADDIKKLELNSTDAFDALMNGSRASSRSIWKLAEAWGITKDNFTDDELYTFIDALVDMGVVSEDATKSVLNLDSAISKVKSRTNIFNQIDGNLNSNKLFDSIAAADETANAGDDYVKADSYLDEAKEMYDKGLVGTDDFKARAAYFSPTLSENAEDFADNYKKASQYLTENSSGVKKFLKDLETKGYATTQTMEDGTKQWTYKIEDFEKTAQEMGVSTEFLLDMFGRLEDYGFSNNFASSVDEANTKIVDKMGELASAKGKLAEMEAIGASEDSINRQRELIKGLETDLIQLQETKKYLAAQETEDYARQIQVAKETYKSLAEQRQELLNNPDLYGEDTNSMVKLIEAQMNQLQQDYYLEIDGELNIVGINTDEAENSINRHTIDLTNRPTVSGKDLKQAGWLDAEASKDDTATVYSSAYSNDLGDETVLLTPILPNGTVLSPEQLQTYANQLLNGEEIDADVVIKTFEGEDSIAQSERYAEALHEVHEAYYLGDEASKQALESLKEFSAEQLNAIDFSDGKYSEGEELLQSLMQDFELSEESAKEFIDVLVDMGLIMEKTADVELAKKLEETNSQLIHARNRLKQFTKTDGTVDISIPGAQAAIDEFVRLFELKQKLEQPAIMDVDTSNLESGMAASMEALQEYWAAVEQLELVEAKVEAGVDVSDAEIAAAKSKVTTAFENARKVGVPSELKLSQGDEQIFRNQVRNLNPEIVAKVVGSENVILLNEEISDIPENQKVTINADVKGEERIISFQQRIQKIRDDAKNAIKYDVYVTTHSNSVATGTLLNAKPNTFESGTGNNSSSSGAGGVKPYGAIKYTGTMLSPARASGTAYNMLNLKPAYANGQVALTDDEFALVNELGVIMPR